MNALDNLMSMVNRIILVLLVLTGCEQGQPDSAAPHGNLQATPGWASQATTAIAASEYAFSLEGSEFRAINRAQDLLARFDADGVAIQDRSSEAGAVRLHLRAWGRDGTEAASGRSSPALGDCQVDARVDAFGDCLRRIDYSQPGLTEWWENRPEGLEQGFTITSPPDGDEPLVLDIVLTGVDAEIDADGTSALLRVETGPGFNYTGLAAWDSLGHALPAWMEPTDAGLRLLVDDSDAVGAITVDPLLTSASWTAESNQASARLGFSVSSAGDVNGDGFGDMVVGAHVYDNGQTDEGRAFLYLGSAAGLATTAAWTAESNQASAYFGYAVSSAGDVNGDGYGDVLVGAYSFDNGQADEGRAYLFLGSAAGLSATSSWTAESDQASAQYGYSVASAGDVNGDGYGDVVVGANAFDNGQTDEGRAFLYFGSSSGLSATSSWTGESDQASAQYGYSVSSAGDVNGDGYGDVVAGAYLYDNGQTDEGRAFLYLGSTAGLASTASWMVESDQSAAYFGYSVSSAGDVNADGYGDVLVGANLYDNGQTDEGRAFLYLGSASGALATASWSAESDQASAALGIAVSSAGDVNGDGYGDVVVGAHAYDNGQTDEGRAWLFLGSAAGLSATASWSAESDQAWACFGRAVSSAGDVNGDGFGDLVVGAYAYANGQTEEGRVQVYLGSAASLASTASSTIESNQASAQFGSTVSSVGDVNGDGYGDVVVGSFAYDNGQTDEGRAYLYLGSASGTAVAASWTAESEQASTNFGYSVASAGDVNADGYGDVLVGAYLYDNGQTNEGRAYLYIGSATGLTASWTAESDQAFAEFGYSVSSAGDVNGDGYGDVAVGAPSYDNGQSEEGRVWLYLGSASGLAGTASWIGESDQASANFGFSLSSAGDVNGDGYSDLMVGIPNLDNGQTNEGRAQVYRGSASGLVSSVAWTAESDQAFALFGTSVASAGDVNGDGYGDVAVGATYYDNGQTDEGRAYVYHGSSSGLASSASWTAESDLAGPEFGRSVSSAGDVNGDGYGDLVVGAPYHDNGQTDEGRAYLYLGSLTGLAATASRTVESDQTTAYLGISAASAGDVNGDGYGDVIVGSSMYDNGQTDEGRALLYLGNGADGTGTGLALVGQARRPGLTTPIAAGLASPSSSAFDVNLASARGPWGRSNVKVQVEAKPLGTRFNGSGLTTQSTYTSSGFTGASITEPLTGLTQATGYHWRARVLASPAEGRSQGWGHWFYGGASGNAQGAHVFTGGGITLYRDADGDGYGNASLSLVSRSATVSGYVANAIDCNDASATVNPGATEVTGDGIDQTCDGQEICYIDDDNDNYRLGTTQISPDTDCLDSGEALASDPTGECNDANFNINPGATEIIGDNVDQNCNGQESCYIDADNDNYRLGTVVNSTDTDCLDNGEAVSTDPTNDCNDASAAIHPGATEVNGDSVDQDCNGQEICYVDADNDNYRLSTTVTSTDSDCLDSGEGLATDPATDCNDTASSIHPGATEVVGDQVDQTCDNQEVCYVDSDNDNYRLSTTINSIDTDCLDNGEGLASDPTGECNDDAVAINPGATEGVGDQVDQNCNGQEICYVDADNDNFRLTTTVTSTDVDCGDSGEALSSDPSGDCNDAVSTTYPGATEIVGDQVDQSCDGRETCYVDADNDNYRLTSTVLSMDSDCGDTGESPSSDGADCNDALSAIHPGATEIAGDNVDQDCDNQELCYIDADNDTYRLTTTLGSTDADCGDSGEAMASDATGECNDSDATVHPGALEYCNGHDDDCDGSTDESHATDAPTWYQDLDEDGFGDPGSPQIACYLPAGYVDDDTDCDDSTADVSPDASEYCNEIDDNCDGVVDEPEALGAPTWYEDADADGHGSATVVMVQCDEPFGYVDNDTDCDETNPTVYPAAPEYCNLIDDDCDTLVDEDDAVDPLTWHADADIDGYGDPSVLMFACNQPEGWLADATDCNDLDPSEFPGADEFCDGQDDDCDGTVDEPDALDAVAWYADTDADGFGDALAPTPACSQPLGYLPDTTDCDDGDATVFPGATETCDGHDDDCDGTVDESDALGAPTWHADADSDGYGDLGVTQIACDQPTGFVADSTDCNDLDELFHPGAAETCDDPSDYNCDGSVAYQDLDADGFPACLDCNDADSNIHSGATETCNGNDDDCDGSTDEPDAIGAPTWYLDADGDGYGDPTLTSVACQQPVGSVSDSTDCDDSDAAFNPAAREQCDDPTDYNCDGSVGYTDADNDGYPACEDCDDQNSFDHPGGSEVCDDSDNDCDGLTDEPDAVGAPTWYFDSDDDAYGDATVSIVACDAPAGFVEAMGDCDDTDAAYNPGAKEACEDLQDYNCDGSVGDADADGDGYPACQECDDSDADIFPGATEYCDGADNNCDGVVDEPEAVDASTWYADVDGDGFGDAANTQVACDAPVGHVGDSTDCDDAHSTVNPDADEVCDDLLDNDCDGDIDEDCVDTEDTGPFKDTDSAMDTSQPEDTGTEPKPPCGCQSGIGGAQTGLLIILMAMVMGRRRRSVA